MKFLRGNLVYTAFIDWREKSLLNRARKALLGGPEPEPEITRNDWPTSLGDPTKFYTRCYRYFHKNLPAEVRAHRQYFEKDRRGFGEDAFHAMWFLLMREFRAANFLEIGVYRGQTLSLLSFLQRHWERPVDVTGISPFLSAGDSVSRYHPGINYFADTLVNFDHFNLPRPNFEQAFSTDAAAVTAIQSRRWQLIYIDGNHDYEVAKVDWNHCASALASGGLIVLDDSALQTRYEPPLFATKGHPGPSRVAEEVDRSHFVEILQVGHNRVFQKL